jgi:hypothetical protein
MPNPNLPSCRPAAAPRPGEAETQAQGGSRRISKTCKAGETGESREERSEREVDGKTRGREAGGGCEVAEAEQRHRAGAKAAAAKRRNRRIV